MKEPKPLPDTDAEPETPHPRETFTLIGHDNAEETLAEALGGARMHHAWLLTGPKGVGKATLAYRFIRAALGARTGVGKRPLEGDPGDPISRRIAARAHPDLFTLRRGYNERGKPRREITVDEARALVNFFTLAPAEGGMRVALIDAADDLNRNAANAILKTLEEPPQHAVLVLIAHAPGGLLPTIRSRCRTLPLRPLSNDQVRTAAGENVNPTLLRLAAGRPGRAIALKAQSAALQPETFDHMLEGLVSRRAAESAPRLFEALPGEPAEKFQTFIELAAAVVHARAARDADPQWAELWSNLEQLRAETEGLDMDPKLALARAAAMLDRASHIRR